MRRTAAVAGLLVFVWAGYVVSQRFSPQHQVRALVARQVDLWNGGDVAGLYTTLSPAMQARCPAASFDALAAKGQQALAGLPIQKVTVDVDGVTVTGATATVTATAKIGPQVIRTIDVTDPLTYVKTADGWKLDSAGQAGDQACAAASLPAAGTPSITGSS